MISENSNPPSSFRKNPSALRPARPLNRRHPRSSPPQTPEIASHTRTQSFIRLRINHFHQKTINPARPSVKLKPKSESSMQTYPPTSSTIRRTPTPPPRPRPRPRTSAHPSPPICLPDSQTVDPRTSRQPKIAKPDRHRRPTRQKLQTQTPKNPTSGPSSTLLSIARHKSPKIAPSSRAKNPLAILAPWLSRSASHVHQTLLRRRRRRRGHCRRRLCA